MSEHFSLTGRRFSLKAEICGIECQESNKRTVVLVPAGSVIAVEVDSGPMEDGMVLVRWAGRKLALFVEDLEARGELTGAQNS